MTLKEFRNQYYRIGLVKLRNAKTGKFLPRIQGRFDDWIIKMVDVGIETSFDGNTAHAYLLLVIEEDKK